MYHTFPTGEGVRFDVAHFPALPASPENIAGLLNIESGIPATEKIPSCVKDHSINSQSVVKHPVMATLISISTKEFSPGNINEFFEASRENGPISQGLETTIRIGLT
jgi:hypothetical protein